MEWLLDHIGHLIDWHQYGGQKGNGVAHYLIDFINFVQYNQDLKNIHAVLAVAIDFSKAFNRQNHNILITLLSDLGVQGWLLKLVVGFLENRELIVNYKGETSEKVKLPGGGPQGTILGMFLFLVLINAAGFKEAIKNTGEVITKPFNRRGPLSKIHLKFIDDLTVAEAVNLKSKLVPNPNPNPPRPLTYHGRTGHVLADGQSEVQKLLLELNTYVDHHQMKINEKKTKVILFNNSRKYDFPPHLGFDDNDDDVLEVVEELRLLGVVVTSNLNWQAHVDYMCTKAFNRLWMIRRLKPLGATTDELIKVYQTQIRCILEFAVAAWNSGLTKAQINQLERAQKCALAIILQEDYISYSHALSTVNLESLQDRRHALCLKFARKAQKHPKFTNWFCPNDQTGVDTRSEKKILKPVQARTCRFEKSPIAYLTRLLNENP